MGFEVRPELRSDSGHLTHGYDFELASLSFHFLISKMGTLPAISEGR